MAEYLLEVRSDEIPSRLLLSAMSQLRTRLAKELTERHLVPREVAEGLSQRRFVLAFQGLPEQEPDREERELGPPVAEARHPDGSPTEALLRFADRVGASLKELKKVKTEKGEYAARIRKIPGRPLTAVLQEIVPRALGELRWQGPKLRWGQVPASRTWIRPVRGLLSLLDGEILPLQFGGAEAGRSTIGHPVLSPEPFEVENLVDYREKLEERGLEISFEARRETLRRELGERATRLGGELPDLPDVLEKMALRCEIPGVVEGAFDKEYLTLPPEVARAALGQRQAAFPLVQGEDVLPFFLTVMDRPDDPEGTVRMGQEWAAAGNLDDARFYYDSDRRTPLAERARRLDQLEFHPRLGHFGEKSRRLVELAQLIAGELGLDSENELAAIREAAELLKADLNTAMVRNFNALRGRAGGLYAREEGYIESVWQAIYDQYRPASLDEGIPRGRVGRLLAVADRLDILVGFFGIGEVPTGSKDPLALRRLAQGLLRILIDAEIPLDLDLVAAHAVLLYNDEDRVLERDAEEIVKALQSFLADRLRYLLGQNGYTQDEIEAAMAVGTTNLPDLSRRIEALRQVREEPGFRSLVLAAKRIFNIVRDSPEYELKPELIEEEAEKDLYSSLVDTRDAVDEATGRHDHEEALRHMAGLVPELERFFSEVLVMDEDENRRENRMALLQKTRRVFWKTARLKEMAPERPEAEGSG